MFGSLLCVKTPGIKDGKLDNSRIHSGIFLDYTLKSINFRYLDKETKITNPARHFRIEEAHFISPDIISPHKKDLLKDKPSHKDMFHPGPAKIKPTAKPSQHLSITPATEAYYEDI